MVPKGVGVRTTFTHRLNRAGTTDVKLPPSFTAVAVRLHRGVITIWVEVWSKDKPEPSRFYVIPSGQEIPNDDLVVHVGTVFEGEKAFHIYHGWI